MGERTKIEWCDATFNPWLGCTELSPACDHCYARSWAIRTGQPELWAGERRRTTANYWRQPLKWNREAEAAGARRRVFCASLADVFDNQVPSEWLADLLDIIEQTPHLDWLLLTKRPQNIVKRLTEAAQHAIGKLRQWIEAWIVGEPPSNVWLGTTVENQEEADRRIPDLLKTPAAVRFLSCEPLLGPIKLPPSRIVVGFPQHIDRYGNAHGAPLSLHWVICGGESGPRARPMHPAWVRSLRDQCQAAGVPFFFKQWGEWAPAGPAYPEEVEATEEQRDAWEQAVMEAPDIRSGNVCCMARSGEMAIDYRYSGEYQPRPGSGSWWLERIGKKAAGRLLDGVKHDAMPEVRR